MSLSGRLFGFAEGEGRADQAALAREAGALARQAEQLEHRARALDALAEILPASGTLRVGVRRYGGHVVAWIDTPAGAREGSGATVADALLSAAVAGSGTRRAPGHAGRGGL